MVFMTTALATGCKHNPQHMPSDFVILSEYDPTLIIDARYHGPNNFLGRPVNGYDSPHLVMTKKAAAALKKAHDAVKAQGYRMVIYDSYRPQRAVNDFKAWSEDLSDQITKDLYYPTLEKDQIISSGYIATKSAHSRGSTVDLTLIKATETYGIKGIETKTLTTGETISFLNDGTIDMGGSLDQFHDISHHNTTLATPKQLENREILRQAMLQAGFDDYRKEWWHYSYLDDPYPDTYFDFVVPKL